MSSMLEELLETCIDDPFVLMNGMIEESSGELAPIGAADLKRTIETQLQQQHEEDESTECSSDAQHIGSASVEIGEPLNFSLSPLEGFDPAQISIEPVVAVDGVYGQFGGRCVALRNVLTQSECEFLIEHMAAETSLHDENPDHKLSLRDRRIYKSQEIAHLLWQRVRPVAETLAILVEAEDPGKQRLLQSDVDSLGETSCPLKLRVGSRNAGLWTPIGLNDCLRFCRYHPGGFFRSHCDGIYQKSEDEMSFFTCMFYLDGDMDGGATRFLDVDAEPDIFQPADDGMVLASVKPSPGLCLLFFQPGLLHEGEELRHGVKHILRTEVMFHRDLSTKPRLSQREQEAWLLAREAVAIGDQEPEKACKLYARAFKLDPSLEKLF